MKFLVLIAVGTLLIGLIVGTTIYIDDFNKSNRNKPPLIDMDYYCSEDNFATEVYLNHTISNGGLKRICSLWIGNLLFEIDAFDDGYLMLDMPKDLFWPDVHFSASVNHYGDDGIARHYIDEEWGRQSVLANKELFETYSQYLEEVWGIDSNSQHYRLITKVASFDDFDRYKIPFLKEDVIFHLVFDDFPVRSPADYNPYKYADKTLMDMDHYCSSELLATEVYLNHTISNGELKRICSITISQLFFEINAFDDGYLMLEMPKDLFWPKYGHFTAYVNHYYGDGLNRQYIDGEYTPESQYRLITKVASSDDFDRYKIPFLKEDVVFRLAFDDYHLRSSEPFVDYNPQKYAIQTAQP